MNYKCILAYGLTEEELDKIQKRRLKVKEINNDHALMRIVDILGSGSDEDTFDELPKDEKALIFNGYNDKELRETFSKRAIEHSEKFHVDNIISKWESLIC